MIWIGENCLDQVSDGVHELWGLVLNPMPANAERGNLKAVATTREETVEFIKAEKVEPYQDGQWGKVFKKDGPLEWCNLPMAWNGEIDGPVDDHWGHGIIKLELVPTWQRTE